jgi:hypothetical protein
VKNPFHIVDEATRDIEGEATAKRDKAKELVAVMRDDIQDTDLNYAWDLYKDAYIRTIVNSLFLSNTPFEVMARTTEIPAKVLSLYGEYIFDLSVFRNRLERISFVNTYCQYVTDDEGQFLRAAITCGSDYVVWLINGDPRHPPKEVLNVVMMDGFFRSQAHRGAPLTSELAKQARGWLQDAHRAAVNLQKLDPKDDEDALRELHMTLAYQDDTTNEEHLEAPRPEDILH